MSRNRTYVGHIAMLQQKLTAIQQEDAVTALMDAGSPLRINYEGDLIYTVKELSDEEPAGIIFTDTISEHSLPSLALAAGYHIFSASITPYICNWYDATDCHLDLLTVEQFKDRSRFMRIRTKNCIQKEPSDD